MIHVVDPPNWLKWALFIIVAASLVSVWASCFLLRKVLRLVSLLTARISLWIKEQARSTP